MEDNYVSEYFFESIMLVSYFFDFIDLEGGVVDDFFV